MPRPSFQKLILQPTLQSRQLRIPDDFLRKHGAQLSTIATLKVPDGTVWRLGLKNVDNHICFVDGWQDFVQRYSISIGYFLVFTYEGNSNFIVHIFNMSAAELNYRSATSSRTEGACHGNYHPIFQDIEDIDSDSPPSNFTPGALQDKVFAGSMDQLTPAKNNIQLRHENNDAKNTSRRKRKSDLSAPETSAENDEEVERNRSYESASARIRRNVDNGERERVLNESEAFESTLPNCRVILRPSYLYRGCIMYFPSSFAANLSDVSGSIKLQTSDGGKQWPVRCLYKEGQAKLSQGWYEFALENNLGEGDVCIFERLKTSEAVLQVTLFCLKEDQPSLAAPC